MLKRRSSSRQEPAAERRCSARAFWPAVGAPAPGQVLGELHPQRPTQDFHQVGIRIQMGQGRGPEARLATHLVSELRTRKRAQEHSLDPTSLEFTGYHHRQWGEHVCSLGEGETARRHCHCFS